MIHEVKTLRQKRAEKRTKRTRKLLASVPVDAAQGSFDVDDNDRLDSLSYTTGRLGSLQNLQNLPRISWAKPFSGLSPKELRELTSAHLSDYSEVATSMIDAYFYKQLNAGEQRDQENGPGFRSDSKLRRGFADPQESTCVAARLLQWGRWIGTQHRNRLRGYVEGVQGGVLYRSGARPVATVRYSLPRKRYDSVLHVDHVEFAAFTGSPDDDGREYSDTLAMQAYGRSVRSGLAASTRKSCLMCDKRIPLVGARECR
jgi:hypothetical protein